jgi:hypothetical protein
VSTGKISREKFDFSVHKMARDYVRKFVEKMDKKELNSLYDTAKDYEW